MKSLKEQNKGCTLSELKMSNCMSITRKQLKGEK